MKYVLALLGLLFCGNAYAQDALVVATCGTLPQAYAAGATRLLTVDTTGKICGTGGGGAGNPGGSNTQVQYNNAGSFGGITGATTNGTALTLVAPVLGTPASGTLTNTTGYLLSNLSGAGTGVLTALAVNIGSAGAPVLFNGAGGTPSSITLTNGTGLPIAGTTGYGTGVAGALAANLNASTGLIGALTATNGNCTVGNGTAWTSAACPGGTAANPSATAGATAINGAATTYMRSDGAPAVAQGSSSVKGIVQVDGTTITAASGVISAAALTVTTSVQTGTNYAFVTGDQAKVIYLNNASAQTPTVAQAGTTGFAAGYFVTACNIGAGIQTLTPATSTIGGAATLAIPGGTAASPRCYTFISDGTNYLLVPSGNTYTIFSGSAALATGAIGSAACVTAATISAPGVVTTDVVLLSFNGDPTGVTGFAPLTSGMLTFLAYPTANNIVVKECNNTTSSITPGAMTLNAKVVR